VCSLPGYYVAEAAAKQRLLTSKVVIFASLDGLQSDTPREPAPLGRVYSEYQKATDRRLAMALARSAMFDSQKPKSVALLTSPRFYH